MSFHSVECFLEQFQVRSTASLFTGRLDPFFLERVLGRTIGFVKHAKDAGERERGEFICGELVGNVVAHFILGCAVPFSFLDHFEAAAFLRISRIEYVREKFDALRETFDDAEALVIERALDQLDHVRYLRGVRARDECGAAGDQFFHRIDRLIDGASGIGLALESDRRRGRGLFLGQAIDEIVHDEIRHVDVLAPAVIDMIATDGEPIAVAAKEEHVKIRPGETDAAGERDGATVNVMRAVTVDEIRKPR